MLKRNMMAVYLLLATSLPLFAQSKLLSPEEFLGYPLGEKFTPHYKVVEYCKHVVQAVSHVNLEEYGTTYENRPLMVAYISTPENIKRLDEIRINNLRRAGLMKGDPVGEKTAIVWLSYNVHGNESVSTEASMATVYALADPKNKAAREWLKNTLVIIDPCLNPDGRDRYVHWYNQVASYVANPDPQALEHEEPWPGGRANHYLFDLNRDWAWITQVESQQRIRLYNQWMPHVHVDFHEQGIDAPYYFAPAAEPLHEFITPWQREFQVSIGKNNARHFDKNNWLYFTKEVFDLFYPSYGDTYPLFNGAIGMTYEQGGSGKAGLAVLTAEGDTLTLKDRITHHFTSGLSTIEVVSENASKVVDEFEKFFINARTKPPGQYKTYIIKNDNGMDKLKDLTEWLDKHEITYGSALARKNVKGLNYHTGKEEIFALESNDLVISAYQTKSTLLQVLFEPSAKLPDSITYDITAWSVPYIYDLKAYASKERISVAQAYEREKFRDNKVTGKPYAYLAAKESLNDLKFLSHLLKQKVKVRYSQEDFEIEAIKYKAGTLIITRRGNEKLGEKFDELVTEAADRFERKLTQVPTGLVSAGKDFGSSAVIQIKAPRVAVLAGEEVSSLAFGEVWHFFEQQISYPLSVLKAASLKDTKLASYDVLIVPNGEYTIFDSTLISKINLWVKEGGKLILMESALNSFTGQEGFGLTSNTSKLDELFKKPADDGLAFKDYKDRERKAISDQMSGSIYKVRFDNSHPLASGYDSRYYTLKTNTSAYSYLESGWNVGIINTKDALVSGFAGANVKAKMHETLVFGVEDSGEGKIIYMVDNPLFRAFWHNGKLLFGNAVFLR